eukprot:COSAG03_NODE_18284_length_358_cov_0.764479_2_plen_85_part_01
MQSLCDLATQLSVVTARQRLPVQTLTASEHHNVIQRTTHCTVYHCIGADTARGWRSATTKCGWSPNRPTRDYRFEAAQKGCEILN